jgi:hypothetical protein
MLNMFQPALKQVANMGVIQRIVDDPPGFAGAHQVQIAQAAQLM